MEPTKYVTRFCESNAEGIVSVTSYRLTSPMSLGLVLTPEPVPWVWDWFLLQNQSHESWTGSYSRTSPMSLGLVLTPEPVNWLTIYNPNSYQHVWNRRCGNWRENCWRSLAVVSAEQTVVEILCVCVSQILLTCAVAAVSSFTHWRCPSWVTRRWWRPSPSRLSSGRRMWCRVLKGRPTPRPGSGMLVRWYHRLWCNM